MKPRIAAVIAFLMAILCVSASSAQEVVKHPRPSSRLSDRWEWAQQEARRADDIMWIGYSIERMMGEHSYMTSGYNSRWKNRASMYEMIDGVAVSSEDDRSDNETLQDVAQEALNQRRGERYKERKVLKDLALLFLVDSRSGEIEDVNINNMESHFDLKGYTLLWLGTSDDAESLFLLQRQYQDARTTDLKEDLVTALGVHDDTGRVVPILTRILDSRENNDVREQAAFWLGQQDVQEALDVLIRTARQDRSDDVREQAVFAISQMDFPEATDTLIDLARNADNREVRKTSIFWLGQKASEKAVAALNDVIQDSEDSELQEQAVFAISQLPSNQGIPMLIDIAKTHRNGEVRKKAIFWLGQTGDPRALDTLVDLVRGQ